MYQHTHNNNKKKELSLLIMYNYNCINNAQPSILQFILCLCFKEI